MRLVGRDDELQVIEGLVSSHRLVTLTGQGGIGKTRLAAELIAGGRVPLERSVSWVDLTSVSHGDEVPGAFATGCGIGSPLLATADSLVKRLHPSGHLLVVDNCEHVINDAAELIETLLASCPHVSILATSRLPLEVAGEVTWRLAPLSTPQHNTVTDRAELAGFGAPALFLERARQADPRHQLDNADVSAILSICALLDGNPLALQLAGARVGSIGLEQLHAALVQSLGILDGSSRRGPPRQRSVTVSLQWSYDLLGPETQRLLRSLSILEGSFDVEAADALLGGTERTSASTSSALSRLVEVGFVDFYPDIRRHVLLFTVRQFAAALLHDAGERAAVVEAHAMYWLARGAASMRWGELYDPGQVAQHASDIRSALRWAMQFDPDLACSAIASFGTALVQLTVDGELNTWFDWLTELQPRSSRWAHAIAAIAPFGLLVAKPPLRAAIDEAKVDAAERGDETVARMLLIPQLFALSATGSLEGVAAFLEQAERADDGFAIVAMATQAAWVSAVLGNHASVGFYADAARWAARAGGLQYWLTAAAIAERLVAQQRGELDAASRAPRTGGHGSPVVATVDLVVLAGLSLDRGDRNLLNQAMAELRSVEPVDPVATRRIRWIDACLAQRWDEALVLAEPFRRPPTFVGVFAVETLLAFALTATATNAWADVAETLRDLEQTIGLVREPTLLASASIALLRARVALQDNSVSNADRYVHEAIQLANANGFALVLIDALETLAVVSLHRANQRLAARLLGACEARRVAIGYANRMASAATDEHRAAVDPAQFDEARVLTMAQATALARRARGSRRRPLTGIESLTPTERMVADRAAAGRSTLDISGELFMSPATVKTHLTHIYRKLGVNNRSELTSHLA